MTDPRPLDTNMGHPILRAFDLETTGIETDSCRIVELALCDKDGKVRLHSLVNPGIPIPPEAIAVHGITDEMVADAPRFAVLAAEVQAAIADATLVSYAGRAFDTLVLDRELRRAKQPGIDLDTVVEIDLYRAWQELEPRTLAGARKRYLQRASGEQHRALQDTVDLPALLHAMARRHAVTVEDLVRLSRPEDECDRSGKFKLDAEGKVRFNFGKHDGDLARDHVEYLVWMRDKGDFPSDTMHVVKRILRKVRATAPDWTDADEGADPTAWD